MRGEASMGSKPLPSHHVPHSQLSLRHVAQMLAPGIHDHVFIRLLEAQHQIHHFHPALDHDGGVGQDLGGRVARVEDAMGIFGQMDGSEEIVFGRVGVAEGVRDCVRVGGGGGVGAGGFGGGGCGWGMGGLALDGDAGWELAAMDTDDWLGE